MRLFILINFFEVYIIFFPFFKTCIFDHFCLSFCIILHQKFLSLIDFFYYIDITYKLLLLHENTPCVDLSTSYKHYWWLLTPRSYIHTENIFTSILSEKKCLYNTHISFVYHRRRHCCIKKLSDDYTQALWVITHLKEVHRICCLYFVWNTNGNCCCISNWPL